MGKTVIRSFVVLGQDWNSGKDQGQWSNCIGRGTLGILEFLKGIRMLEQRIDFNCENKEGMRGPETKTLTESLNLQYDQFS
ncbi:hypothetical protein VNO77_44232 [Canavalia gladiata]|uniref:Uncharacterized protein n=1 Tax=Canavalia gladiata TaxID=3824 RepID=A0AAN9PQ67_CANGL